MLVVGLVALSALTVVADEYGNFIRTDTSSSDWVPSSVALNQGDQLVILNCNGSVTSQSSGSNPYTYYRATIECDYSGSISYTWVITTEAANYSTYYNYYDREYSPENERTIVGACTCTPSTSSGNGTVIAYKIIRASDNSISPSNVISLPADVNGDMQLIFESSDDLLTWTQEFSFTHNSGGQSSKFFRTRLIQN